MNEVSKTATRQDGQQETNVGATQASPEFASTARSDPADTTTLDFGDRGTVTIVGDGSALAQAAAERFATAVERAVAARGQAAVALSGGSTPKQMGTLLAREPYRSRIPWDRLHVFWGDERWVPLASPESNAGEAKRGFLDLVPIPESNVHAWDTEAASPAAAAATYEQEMRAVFANADGPPRFDLVLLGMGDDGHTASLFPHTSALAVSDRLAAANFVPKLNADRLTLTAPVLNAGREILFLAGGPGKADRIESVLEGPIDTAEQPSQLIRAGLPDGALGWLIDEDAARKLSRRG
ncbi:MAG: 6-phosphogluconolactonase [Thermomicrobiales bacterium]